MTNHLLTFQYFLLHKDIEYYYNLGREHQGFNG